MSRRVAERRRREDWSGYHEPSVIPGPAEAFVFMGCRPWDRAAESPPVVTCADCGGATVVCDRCGREGRLVHLVPIGPDGHFGPCEPLVLRGKIAPGDRDVCLGCGWWGQDARVVAALYNDHERYGTVEPLTSDPHAA